MQISTRMREPLASHPPRLPRSGGNLFSLALICFLLAACGFDSSSATAETSIQLATNPTLSPDGSQLAFTWRGDLWSVSITGGQAKRLTVDDARDSQPEFSPDGQQIAFVSDRSGSNQLYVMPASGGSIQQLTYHTEGYSLLEWYPNGESLLVSATRDHFWKHAERFFEVQTKPRTGESLLFDAYGENGTISPDGKQLLFSREGVRWWRKGYVGSQASQIWLYDLKKQKFRQVVKHPTGCRSPLWDPSGKSFYYVSGESGAMNLWHRDLASGEQTQVTDFDDDSVLFPRISRDGKTIVFRHLFDFYAIHPGELQSPQKIEIQYNGDERRDPVLRRTLSSATELSFSKDGLEVAFIAGGDVWVMDTELREPKQVTDTAEEERGVLFAPDGSALLFVSDQGGQCDIWRATRDNEEIYWWQNDAFVLQRLTKDTTVETGLTWSPTGKMVGFIKTPGDFWVMKPDGNDARRVFSSWNRPDYDWSPDGNWIVYANSDNNFNRDVFILPLDGSREPFNLSLHPDNDFDPIWSPDGTLIAFTGKRAGEEVDICFVHLRADKSEVTARDRKLEKALEKIQKVRKSQPNSTPTNAAKSKTPPKHAVNGRLEDQIEDPPAKDPPAKDPPAKDPPAKDPPAKDPPAKDPPAKDPPAKDPPAKDPPAKDPPAKDPPAKDPPAKDPPAKDPPAKDPPAKAEKPSADEPAVSEDKDTDESKEDGLRIDFEGIHDRLKRISIPNTSESGLFWSHDSKRLAFRAEINGRTGTYTIAPDEDLKPKLLSTATGSHATWIATGNQIVWLSNGKPSSLSASNGKTTSYSFSVKQAVEVGKRYETAFMQAWRLMRDHFYDERMNNRNWDAIYRKYSPLAVKAVDLSMLGQVVSMMLGELNGSHLGFTITGRRSSTSSSDWQETTAHLGLRFDPDHHGPGLKVRDVIWRGPADRQKSEVLPGEIVLSIDGKPVDPALDLTTVLNGQRERDVHVTVQSAQGDERQVVLRPTTYAAARSALYEMWVRHNREKVSQASQGTLGYLHIQGMNMPSFHRFERELYQVASGKEGIVIDVRENGGGFTADHLLTSLTQPRHAITVSRGGQRGYPQDRMIYATWNKPIIVLCNQNSFSNAEIFAHAIKTLKRGRVVGVTTSGSVISTGGTRVMDIGYMRLPGRGWFVLDSGLDMELNGAVPHVTIWPKPGELPQGIDRQLTKAVQLLKGDVKKWRQRKQRKLRTSAEIRRESNHP